MPSIDRYSILCTIERVASSRPSDSSSRNNAEAGGMVKFSLGSDDSYATSYKGHSIAIRRAGTAWIASSGGMEGQACDSREEAFVCLAHAIDAAASPLPEIDALIRRWVEEVDRIAPRLEENDAIAHLHLLECRSTLAITEQTMRATALRFEELLAKLQADAR
jgi:hypothetical protein